MVLKIVYISVLVLILSACSQRKEAVNEVDKHVVKSGELRVIMRELNYEMDYKHESELERDEMRRRYALRLAKKIKNRSFLMHNLSKEDFGKNMGKDEIDTFYKYADRLSENAQNIEDIANSYELEKLDDAIAEINHTCNSCHQVFRSN